MQETAWHPVLTVLEGVWPPNTVSFSFQGAEAVSAVLAQTCCLFPHPALPTPSPRGLSSCFFTSPLLQISYHNLSAPNNDTRPLII